MHAATALLALPLLLPLPPKSVMDRLDPEKYQLTPIPPIQMGYAPRTPTAELRAINKELDAIKELQETARKVPPGPERDRIRAAVGKRLHELEMRLK